MSDELKPCPFCGAGEFRFDESHHWTGQRNILLKVRLRHWCKDSGVQVEIARKTERECIELWNSLARGKP